jgi:hypothetical protein
MLIFRDGGSRREKGGPHILKNGQTCSTETEECLYLGMEGVEGKKDPYILQAANVGVGKGFWNPWIIWIGLDFEGQ